MSFELIPGKWVGKDFPVFVIAEIGQNHQGDLNLAKEMILKAKNCGADCVKFQKSDLSEKFTQKALNRVYDSKNSFGKTYGEHKSFLEFSTEEYEELVNFCNLNQIGMTASAMDTKSVDFLEKINVPFIKIGSGDVNNYFILDKVAQLKHRNAVISTGMSDFEMVENIYEMFKKARHESLNFVIMHCISSYPTQTKDVNLNVIDQYKNAFQDAIIGYSGHELGFLPTLGAVAKGAKVIERHFTLDKSMKGSDHQCSLNPQEFQEMVKSIRSLEQSLGCPQKRFLECEKSCFLKLGKSVVAGRKLSKGEALKLEDLKIKVSDPHGWPAKNIFGLLGRILKVNIEEDEAIIGDIFELQ